MRAEKTAEQIQHESKERDKVTSLLQSLTSDGVGSKFCRVDRQQTLRLITNTDRDRSDTDTTIIETSNQTVNDGLLIALRQRVDGSFIMNKHFSRETP